MGRKIWTGADSACMYVPICARMRMRTCNNAIICLVAHGSLDEVDTPPYVQPIIHNFI